MQQHSKMISLLLLVLGSVSAIRMTYLDISQQSYNAASFSQCGSTCGTLTSRAMPATCTTEDCFCVTALNDANTLNCVNCLAQTNVTLSAEVNDTLENCNDETGSILDALRTNGRASAPCKTSCEPLIDALFVCNPNQEITASSCVCNAVTSDNGACQTCLSTNDPNNDAGADLTSLTVQCAAVSASTSPSSSATSPPVSNDPSTLPVGVSTATGSPTSSNAVSTASARPTIIAVIQIRLSIGGGFFCRNGNVVFDQTITISQGSALSLFSDFTLECDGRRFTASFSEAFFRIKRQSSNQAIPITLQSIGAVLPATDFQTDFSVTSDSMLALNNNGVTYAYGLSSTNILVIYNPAFGVPSGITAVSLVAASATTAPASGASTTTAPPASAPSAPGSGTGSTGTGSTGSGSIGTGSTGSGSAANGGTTTTVSTTTTINGQITIIYGGSGTSAGTNTVTIVNGVSVVNAPITPVIATPSQCDYACVNIFVAVQVCAGDDFDCLCSSGQSTRRVGGITVVRSAFQWGSATCQACVGRTSFSELSIFISNAQAICVPTIGQPIVVTVIQTVTITTYVTTITVFTGLAGANAAAVQTSTVTIPATVVTTTKAPSTFATAAGSTIAPVTTPVQVVLYSVSIRAQFTATITRTATFNRINPTTDSNGVVAPVSTPASNATVSGLFTASPTGVVFPRLLVPVRASNPSEALGSQFLTTVNSTQSLLVLFDIPASSGSQCLLEFDLPSMGINPVNPVTYSLTGGNTIEAFSLASAFTNMTTYATMPAIVANLGTFSLKNGSASILSRNTACTPGSTLAVRLDSTRGTALTFMEMANPNVGIVLNQY